MGQPSQTTIIVSGPYAATWLWLETAKLTFWDLRVQSHADFGFLGSGATRISFCNVVAEFGPSTQMGAAVQPL